MELDDRAEAHHSNVFGCGNLTMLQYELYNFLSEISEEIQALAYVLCENDVDVLVKI